MATGIVTGFVKWFNERKGFGFITITDGDSDKDVFVHYSNIKTNAKYRTLVEGERVQLEVKESDKGLVAFDVQVIEG